MLCHRDDVRAILLCSSPITIAWFTHALCAGLSGSKRRCDHITCRWPLPRDHRTSRALCHHGVGRRGGDLEKPDGPNCLRLSCLFFFEPVLCGSTWRPARWRPGNQSQQGLLGQHTAINIPHPNSTLYPTTRALENAQVTYSDCIHVTSCNASSLIFCGSSKKAQIALF